MTTGLYFLKLELNYLKDPTFNTVLTDGQRWRYVQLNLLAKDLNAGGSFIQHGKALILHDIAWLLHVDADKLQLDMDAMRGIGLLCDNGHGPCLTRFVQEQETPKTDAERKEAQRIRDNEKSRNSHEPVTLRDTESESELKIKSQSQESDIESSVRESDPKPTDDDVSLTDQKKLICTHAGIPPKFSKGIVADLAIVPDDLLAELARNYSRKGKVKNPGYITGLNLGKISPERPAAEWYDQARWMAHLPSTLRSKLGFAVLREEVDSDNQSLVATRIPSESSDPAVDKLPGYFDWNSALELLRQDMSPGDFHKYLGQTHLKDAVGGLFTIVVCGPDKVQNRDWLEGRVTSTVKKILAGITNNSLVDVEFVVEGS